MLRAVISGAFRTIYLLFRGHKIPNQAFEDIPMSINLPMGYNGIYKRFEPVYSYRGRMLVGEKNQYVRMTTNTTVTLISTNVIPNTACVVGVIVNAAGTGSKISIQEDDGTVICEIATTAAGVFSLFRISGVSKVVTSGSAAADVTLSYVAHGNEDWGTPFP